jgi:hypothetical protein
MSGECCNLGGCYAHGSETNNYQSRGAGDRASVLPASAAFRPQGGGHGGGGSFHGNAALGGMNHAWQGGMTGGVHAWQGGPNAWQGGTHAMQGGGQAWQRAPGGIQAWRGDGHRRFDHNHHRRFFASGGPFFDDGYGYDYYAYNCNPYWNGYAWVYPQNDGYSCVAPYGYTY